MTTRRHTTIVLACAALGMSVGSCAKVSRTIPGEVTGGGGSGNDALARDAPASVDAGADVQVNHDAGAPEIRVEPDATVTTSTDAACAMQSAVARTSPLDLYMMVDSSGSMTDKTAAGTTKWAAVQSAMGAFF